MATGVEPMTMPTPAMRDALSTLASDPDGLRVVVCYGAEWQWCVPIIRFAPGPRHAGRLTHATFTRLQRSGWIVKVETVRHPARASYHPKGSWEDRWRISAAGLEAIGRADPAKS